MKDYIKAYADPVIKYLIGREGNEEILIAFINYVLLDSKQSKIKDVKILNPFILKDYIFDKPSILDIRATDENGRTYIIEVQSFYQDFFKVRVLYYWAGVYYKQIPEGDKYSNLEPVISINLINFELFKEFPDYHSWYYITRNGNPNQVLTDHFQVHFIEFPKMKAELPEDAKSNLEKLIYFLKYEGLRSDTMEILIKDDPILTKLHEDYNNFVMDPKLRYLYEAQQKYEADKKTAISVAEERGIEKGIKEGKEETAKLMLKKGLDINLISEISGLTIKEIENLESS